MAAVLVSAAFQHFRKPLHKPSPYAGTDVGVTHARGDVRYTTNGIAPMPVMQPRPRKLDRACESVDKC